MPLRAIRVHHACFVCGADLPLERFISGLPCKKCEDRAPLVRQASRPPRVVELLGRVYQRIHRAPLPRVWIPWISAVAARESLQIPWWDPYRPLDLFLLLAGTSKRPVVLVTPETEFARIHQGLQHHRKTPITQRLPGEQEVLVTTPDRLAQMANLHRFSGFLLWLHPEARPKRDLFPSATLMVAERRFPHVHPHGFQGWLRPGEMPETPEARVLEVPVLRGTLSGITPQQLLEILFLLLPYLPAELQELVVSLYRSEALDSARAQVLREAVNQALDHHGLRSMLENLGMLHRLHLQVPDLQALREQLEQAEHPAQRGPIYLLEPPFARGRYWVHRGFLSHPPPLRQRPALGPLKDTATLLVLLGTAPDLRDLGFRNLWRRQSRGLELLEGVGTLGPVTLVHLPPLFRWMDKHLYPDAALLQALRGLARRYPRITVMASEPLKLQGILTLFALGHLWNRRRLVLYSDFAQGPLRQLEPKEIQEAFHRWLQHHIVFVERRQQLARTGITPTPASWVQELSLDLVRRPLEHREPRKLALVTVDGLTLQIPVPADLPEDEVETRLREESRLEVEPTEESVPPPAPASPGLFLRTGDVADLQTLQTLLHELWRAGLISHPHRAVPLVAYQEVARVLLEDRGLGPVHLPASDPSGLAPTRPLLDLDLRALGTRYRVPQASVPVYRTILLRFLAQFLPPARVQATRIRLTTPFGTAETLKAQKILEVGFTAVVPLPLPLGVVYPDLQITRIRFVEETPSGLDPADFVDFWFFHSEENPNPVALLRSLEPWVRLSAHGLLLTPEGHQLLRHLPSELGPS